MADKHSIDQSILFISYHYPPDARVGAKRVAKLAGFLHGKGYKVGVLTVKEKYYEFRDHSLCNNDLKVFRTNMCPSLRSIFSGIKQFINRFRGGDDPGNTNSSKPELVDRHSLFVRDESTSPGVLGWIRRNILSIIWLPDDRQVWVPLGFFKCLTLVRKYRIIYSSSPPHSAHLIPLLISMFFRNIIWIAEFRDPWFINRKPPFARTKLSDWLERKWKSAIIRKSSKVFVVTEEMKNELAADYPGYEEKIRVYTNGYDEDEYAFAKGGDREKSGKVTFAHAGTFYWGRNPKIFMTAVSELIAGGRINKDDIQINFIGDTYLGRGESIEEYAGLLNIADITRCYGYIPNNECLVELNEADVLLLFSIVQPLQVPAKFYEYLALKKIILSITTGGITSTLVDMTGSGVNVPPDDVSAMKEAIMKIISGQLPERNESEIRKFKIHLIYNDMYEYLDDLTAQR